MSKAGKPYVLLVGLGAEDMPLSEEARGKLSGLVRSCPDVYRALARIGRDPWIRGVIVNVGAVTSGQMEFFSLVRRVRRPLAVHVVATLETVAHRVGDAIEHGATGPLTEDVVAALVAACGNGDELAKLDANDAPPEPALTPVEQRTAQQVDVTSVASEENQDGPVLSEKGDDERDETEELRAANDETMSEPARVPWLRYTDPPGRKAPSQQREPAKREPPSSDWSSSRDPAGLHDENEPLLTDDELAALLDGDGLEGAPDENETDLSENDGGSEAHR